MDGKVRGKMLWFQLIIKKTKNKNPPVRFPDTLSLTGEMLKKGGYLTLNRCSTDVCWMTNGWTVIFREVWSWPPTLSVLKTLTLAYSWIKSSKIKCFITKCWLSREHRPESEKQNDGKCISCLPHDHMTALTVPAQHHNRVWSIYC